MELVVVEGARSRGQPSRHLPCGGASGRRRHARCDSRRPVVADRGGRGRLPLLRTSNWDPNCLHRIHAFHAGGAVRRASHAIRRRAARRRPRCLRSPCVPSTKFHDARYWTRRVVLAPLAPGRLDPGHAAAGRVARRGLAPPPPNRDLLPTSASSQRNRCDRRHRPVHSCVGLCLDTGGPCVDPSLFPTGVVETIEFPMVHEVGGRGARAAVRVDPCRVDVRDGAVRVGGPSSLGRSARGRARRRVDVHGGATRVGGPSSLGRSAHGSARPAPIRGWGCRQAEPR